MIVVVAQMGAVGSVTVAKSLKAVGFQRWHLNLSDDPGWRDRGLRGHIAVHVHNPRISGEVVAECRRLGRRAAVVTMVRELITRNISAYWKNCTRDVPEQRERWFFAPREVVETTPVEDLIADFRSKNIRQAAFFGDAMNKLSAALGVDLSSFDAERGYSLHDAAGVPMLVYQLERTDAAWPHVAKLVRRPGMPMVRGNAGDEKWYGDLYRRFQAAYRPSPEEIDACYGTPLMQRFYSPDQRAGFLARWGL